MLEQYGSPLKYSISYVLGRCTTISEEDNNNLPNKVTPRKMASLKKNFLFSFKTEIEYEVRAFDYLPPPQVPLETFSGRA